MADKAKNNKNRSRNRVVTTSNTIKFEAPKGRRKAKARPTKVVAVAPKVATKPVMGFMDFLREHAIVGLAVGFIIGAQSRILIDQLNKSFIDPFVGLLIGGAGTLSSKTAIFHHDGKETVFAWGAFAYTLINFIAVLAAIYAIIKILHLDKLDKKKD